MEQNRLEALNNGERMDFWANDEPKCPHCGQESSVSENEWWKIYEEGDHEVSCPHCETDFTVTTRVSYTFSTDHQDDD